MLANEARERYAHAMTICCYLDSPVGRLALEADGETLTGVRWASAGERDRDNSNRSPVLKEARHQLERYFARKLKAFDLPLAAKGTDFQKSVWKMMREIPYGETATYGGIAMALASGPRARRHGVRPQSHPDHRALPPRTGQRRQRGRLLRRPGAADQAQAAGPRRRRPSLRIDPCAC